MSPELITLIAMFIAIVGIFINQSNKADNNHKELSKKIDAVNERLTTFQIYSTNRFNTIERKIDRIENKLNMPYSNGVLYDEPNNSFDYEYPVSE